MRKTVTLTLEIETEETRDDLVEEAARNLLLGFEGVHCGEWMDWSHYGQESRTDVADDHEVAILIVAIDGPNGRRSERCEMAVV